MTNKNETAWNLESSYTDLPKSFFTEIPQLLYAHRS